MQITDQRIKFCAVNHTCGVILLPGPNNTIKNKCKYNHTNQKKFLWPGITERDATIKIKNRFFSSNKRNQKNKMALPTSCDASLSESKLFRICSQLTISSRVTQKQYHNQETSNGGKEIIIEHTAYYRCEHATPINAIVRSFFSQHHMQKSIQYNN